MKRKKKSLIYKTKNNSGSSKRKFSSTKSKRKTNKNVKRNNHKKPSFSGLRFLFKEFKRLFRPTYYVSHKLHTNYKNKYGVVNRRTRRYLYNAERRFNHNKKFVQFGKALLNANKVFSFINIAKDIRTIVIAISDVSSSVNNLVELVKIHDGEWLPTKEEFKEVVNIVKNTKDIFDSIKDIGKQTGIIVL